MYVGEYFKIYICINIVIFTDKKKMLSLIDPRFECSICLNCLKDPMLTRCGHRFCSECITTWLK